MVSQEAEIVNKKASEAKAISDDAEADLNAAKPELEAAEAALKNLDKAAIVEIKTFPNPPKAVVMVMEAVMVLLQEKTDWNNVRIVLGDTTGFINKLLFYDVSKTPESVLTKVRNNYFNVFRRNFIFEQILQMAEVNKVKEAVARLEAEC